MQWANYAVFNGLRVKNISYMPWLSQRASAKPVNNLAIPRVQNVELIFYRGSQMCWKTHSRSSQHFFFLRSHLTFLVPDMKHMLKTIPDNYEMYFLHKQKHHEYIFYKVLNGRDGRFLLQNCVSI